MSFSQILLKLFPFFKKTPEEPPEGPPVKPPEEPPEEPPVKPPEEPPVKPPEEPPVKPLEEPPVELPVKPPYSEKQTLKPSNPMKICPKSDEQMNEIEVLGEKIDVSSAGCYFDRGELARILGSKPSFLQSVGNFLTGRGNPYEAADRGAEVIMLQQEIQKSEARLRSLRLGSPEYDLEYTNLKSLNAKMQGMNR